MRIKMQCPDCGKWFTLELSVKEKLTGQVSAVHEDADSSGSPRHGKLASISTSMSNKGDGRRTRSTAWPLRIAPVLIVVALVLVWFFVIGPAIERSRTDIVSETSAATSTEQVSGMSDEMSSEGDSPSALLGETRQIQEADAPPELFQAGGNAALDEPSQAEDDAALDEPSQAEDDAALDGPSQAEDDAALEELSQAEGVAASEAPPVVADAAAADEAPQAGSVQAAEEPVLASGRLEFELVATERCWVHVVTDGGIIYDLTLQAGERRAWKAARQVELAAGSGVAVEIYLNGEFLGTAGPDSRVVEGLVITSEGLSARG